MWYNLIYTISTTLLLLIYYSSSVDSFGGRWRTGAFRSYHSITGRTGRIHAVPKFLQFYELRFDSEQRQHVCMLRQNSIRKVDNMNHILSKIMICSSCRVTTRIYMTEESRDDTSFDFSSKIGWEEYYKRGLNVDDAIKYHDGSNNTSSITTEWHASIPLETISSYCWVNYGTNINTDIKKSILLIGCGTSRLADVIMAGIPGKNEKSNDNVHITLLDSSQTCIDELTRRYQNEENIRCICGDAIQLRSTLSLPHQCAMSEIPQQYDIIIDKGLMDVLFCSDDWTSSVRTLFSEATKVLAEHSGTYILISYKLPKATREILTEIADGVGYTWEFNCVGSTEHVYLSISNQKLTDAR